MTSLQTHLILPPVNFIEQTSQLVKNILDKKEWSLSCEEIVLTSDEVSSPNGLLPILMWVSGQTLEKIWGPQDLSFRCDNDSLCSVFPDLKRPILPPSIWFYALSYELEQVALKNPHGPVIIDEWFEKWNKALQDKKIILLPPLQPNHNL